MRTRSRFARSNALTLTIAAALAAGLHVAAPEPLLAQEKDGPLSISPALLGGLDDPVLGVRAELDLSTSKTVYTTTPYDLELAFDADLPFTIDPDENPETLEIQASLLGFFAPSWGYVSVGLEAAGEAAQRVENADASIGLTFEYDHDRMGWWYAIPRIEAAYDFVGCVGCDIPDVDDDLYHRFDLRTDWSVSFGVVEPALERVRFRPALRWFNAWGIGPGLAEFRDDEGLWGRAQLGYFPRLDWLYEIYVSYRAGELPVRLEEEEAWGVGLSVVF